MTRRQKMVDAGSAAGNEAGTESAGREEKLLKAVVMRVVRGQPQGISLGDLLLGSVRSRSDVQAVIRGLIEDGTLTAEPAGAMDADTVLRRAMPPGRLDDGSMTDGTKAGHLLSLQLRSVATHIAHMVWACPEGVTREELSRSARSSGNSIDPDRIDSIIELLIDNATLETVVQRCGLTLYVPAGTQRGGGAA